MHRKDAMAREGVFARLGLALAIISSMWILTTLLSLFFGIDEDKVWLLWTLVVLLPICAIGIFLILNDPYIRSIGFSKWKQPNMPGLLRWGWWLGTISLWLLIGLSMDHIHDLVRYGDPKIDGIAMIVDVVIGITFALSLILIIRGEQNIAKHNTAENPQIMVGGDTNIERQ
jgi:hypothetical protein